MSNFYNIERWDSVIFGNNTDPVPIIYIKPDKFLLDFAKSNSNVLAVEIEDSYSIYDKRKIPGIWYKSSDIPNCRKNFFDKTGFYVLVLQSPWYGYPKYKGKCTIYGLKNSKETEKALKNDGNKDSLYPLLKNDDDVVTSNLSRSSIIAIFFSIFLMLLICYIISKKHRNI